MYKIRVIDMIELITIDIKKTWPMFFSNELES